LWMVDSSLSAITLVSTDVVAPMWNGFSGYSTNAIDGVGLFYKDAMASGAGAVYDFGSDSILRDVTSGVRYTYTCPSVLRSGDGFAWVQSAAVGADYELVKLDADSGDPVVVGTLVD